VNNPGFAENPPYAGDKRVYMGVEFYDTANVFLKEYQRAYIRKSLDNFKDNTNVIHHLGTEFTGPLHFVQFWLDVIGQWEKENHRKILVMLPGTKDVQDAILADTKRSAVVSGIDVIQWQFRKDGTLYAPPGGVSLTERQYSRIYEPGETSFEQVYRAVSEFHDRYPDKAIVYSRKGTQFADWASFLGGGSLVSLPFIKEDRFFSDATEMQRVVMNTADSKIFALGKNGAGYIIFSESPTMIISLADDKTTYNLKWINPSSGEIVKSEARVKGGTSLALDSPFGKESVAWLYK